MRANIKSSGRDRLRTLGVVGVLTLVATIGSTACGSDSNKPGEAVGGDASTGPGDGGHPGEGGGSPVGVVGATDAGGAGGDTAEGSKSGGAGGLDGAGGEPSLGPGVTQSIDMNGGSIVVEGADGTVTTTIAVPAGALPEPTEISLAPALLPNSSPESVEGVGEGFTIDFGGKTLTVPAKAKLRVAISPDDGDLVILVVTESGTGFVKYTLETIDGVTYAVFDVVEGGRYTPVRLKPEAGCDETLPMAPTIATQADVDKLSKVRRIVGDLRISGTGITSLASLKCLRQIDGALLIDRTGLPDLDGLEKLTFVGVGDVYYYNNYAVQISNNTLLESASLPSVLAVGSRLSNYYYRSVFSVSTNSLLAEFAVDAIESAGIRYESNGAAAPRASISMASLRKAQSFVLSQNPSLKDVDGFELLDTVTGDFTVQNNGLANLDGFKSLKKLGTLVVRDNLSLTTAKGFEKVESATSIAISGNQLLKSVDFAELTAINNTYDFSQSISVESNAGLNDFKADKLASLGGNLSFRQNGNAAVDTVLSLTSLQTISGSFNFSNNLGAQGLSGLKALKSTGDFTLSGNGSLKSTTGLSNLVNVKGLLISQNAKLTDIEGLSKLSTVDGLLTVSNNATLKTATFPALTNLGQSGSVAVQTNALLTSLKVDALRAAPGSISISQNGTAAGVSTTVSFALLGSVANQLSISNNNGLKTLDGFGSLISAGSSISLQGNDTLANVSSLSKLQTISGSLSISSNPALTNLNGLSALTRVTQGITVSSNAALSDITLPVLTSAGAVTISSNAALTDVKVPQLSACSGAFSFSSNGSSAVVTTTTLDFSALSTIGQGFSLSSNPKLKVLSGFPGLSGITGAFYVYGNVLLPNCLIVALRSAIQQKGSITGTVTISGNLVDGCATN
jgi:hypothetical protein